MLFQTVEVQRPIFKGCWSHDYAPHTLAKENALKLEALKICKSKLEKLFLDRLGDRK